MSDQELRRPLPGLLKAAAPTKDAAPTPAQSEARQELGALLRAGKVSREELHDALDWRVVAIIAHEADLIGIHANSFEGQHFHCDHGHDGPQTAGAAVFGPTEDDAADSVPCECPTCQAVRRYSRACGYLSWPHEPGMHRRE